MEFDQNLKLKKNSVTEEKHFTKKVKKKFSETENMKKKFQQKLRKI